MIELSEHATIGDAFKLAVHRYGSNTFIAVPANSNRAYLSKGTKISFSEADQAVRALTAHYTLAGYGVGHRVGLMLENHPEHLLHKLALNSIGVCCVPLNHDLRSGELAFVIDHASIDLVLVLEARALQLDAARNQTKHPPRVSILERFPVTLAPAAKPTKCAVPTAQSPASVLYTSGTTGRPKGCVLSHRYELAAGTWYAKLGGLATIREGGERLYNPLPLFHVNASILSFYCMLLTGNCQVQTDRFQPSRWWTEVRQTQATIVHYLGIVVSLLMRQPEAPSDREHDVCFAIGAGVEPQLHSQFEQRFGFPLLEVWGMTETVRVLIDNHAPRQVGTRAFGRSVPGIDAKVSDDGGGEVPDGTPGDLLVRHSAKTPRKDFFSCYLDDEAATEASWKGGWFHTGDIVTRDDTGMFHFVDRRKNIIRRSGENIAAAEVEAVLLMHPWVINAAVMAVPDVVREEEVLACVALTDNEASRSDMASAIFNHCMLHLAYYKAPGWIFITDQIPTTATQKVQKYCIFPPDVDPRSASGIFDLRHRKKRSSNE